MAGILRALAAASLIVLCSPSRPAGASRSENLVVYFPKSKALIPIHGMNHAVYFPVLQLLNAAGSVTGLKEKRQTLTIWFGNTQIEVRDGSTTVGLNNVKLDLSRPIQVLKGEWQAPTDFLTRVLPTLVNEAVEYDPHAYRVFIGNVEPNTFSVHLEAAPEGARLTVQFAQPVTMRTASSDGRWIVYLGGHPVEPLEPVLHFQNPYLSELAFDDQDGVPKLVLTPKSQGLNFYPSLADNGKLLTAEMAKPGATRAAAAPLQRATSSPPVLAPPATTTSQTAPSPSPPASSTQVTEPAIVLDAGHGGSDTGARGPNGLLEKNLVAAFVSQVRIAILNGQKDQVILTRPGDTDPTFTERAATANEARPAAFISFHAGYLGATSPRIAVYTYQPTAPTPVPSLHTLFIPWNEAQEIYLNRSQRLAEMISEDLAKISGVSVAPPSSAPVRSLRSIAAPAVAMEMGSLSPSSDVAPLTNPTFQQQIASAVARAASAFAASDGLP